MKLPEPLDELSSDEQKILQQYLEPVRFAAGTRLFEEGSPGDGCYIIDEGEVRLEVQRPEVDSDGVLGFLGEGTILGALSLLDRRHARPAPAVTPTSPVAASRRPRSNSTTDNVGYRQLLNVKRLAYYLEPAGAQGV